MVNKKYRKNIDDQGNVLTDKQVADIKAGYYDDQPVCECCHKGRGVIHHHIKQQFTYHGEGYVLQFPDNYSTLCLDCHQHVHASSNQYERNNHKIPKSYFEELKNGQEHSFYVREYLRKNNGIV